MPVTHHTHIPTPAGGITLMLGALADYCMRMGPYGENLQGIVRGIYCAIDNTAVVSPIRLAALLLHHNGDGWHHTIPRTTDTISPLESRRARRKPN